MIGPSLFPKGGPGGPGYDDTVLRGRMVDAEADIVSLKNGKATTQSVKAVRDRVDELTAPGTHYVLAADVPLAVTRNTSGGFINFQVAGMPPGAESYGAGFSLNVVAGLLDADDLFDQISLALTTSPASNTVSISSLAGKLVFTAVDEGVPISIRYDVFGGDLVLAGVPVGEADGTPYGTLKTIQAQATRYHVDLAVEAKGTLPFSTEAITPVGRFGIVPGSSVSLSLFVDGVQSGPNYPIAVPNGTVYDLFGAIAAAVPGFAYTASSATGGRIAMSLIAPAGITSFIVQGDAVRLLFGRFTLFGDRFRGAASAGDVLFIQDGRYLSEIVEELWSANAALRADAADMDALLYGSSARQLSPQKTFRGRGFPSGTTPATTLAELGLGGADSLSVMVYYSPTNGFPQYSFDLQPTMTLSQVAALLRDGNIGRVELGPIDGTAPMRLSIANISDAMFSVAVGQAAFALRMADRASPGVLAKLPA